MAILSKFSSNVLNGGFRFVRNTKLTKFNRLRKLFLSENRISEHEHGEDKFSTRRQPMSSTASDTSTITQVDEFQLQNFMGELEKIVL